MRFTFNGKYLLLAIILFLAEVLIALFVKDSLIRPFLGDVLVVVLIYCFVRIFLNVNYRRAAIGVLIFACVIEVLQYFDYVKLLGLEQNRVLSVAMGRTFEWLDFAAYATGFLIIIAAEKAVHNRKGR
ncbi:MAG TPA: DUF2809 domain-containing protein [Pyrinomonadaceae bacterium]|jgi:hypothetical protein